MAGKKHPWEEDDRNPFDDEEDDHDMVYDENIGDGEDYDNPDEFEFERKERFQKTAEERKRRKEQENEQARELGIDKYGPRGRAVIKEYERQLQDIDPAISAARTLSKLPTDIGYVVLNEIYALTAKAREASRRKNQDEEEIQTGDLEERVGGAFRLAQSKGLQHAVTLDLVIGKVGIIRNPKEYRAAIFTLEKASSEIGKSIGESNLSRNIDALIMGAQKNKLVDPAALFAKFRQKPYLVDIALASEGDVTEVSSEVAALLEDEKTRAKYVAFITDVPASKHLSADRFVFYAEDSSTSTRSDIAFFKHWIGERASKERVQFFDRLHVAYGLDGLALLGKPLMKVLKDKSGDDVDTTMRWADRIYTHVPKKNTKAPRWVSELHETIEGKRPDEVDRVIDGYETMISLREANRSFNVSDVNYQRLERIADLGTKREALAHIVGVVGNAKHINEVLNYAAVNPAEVIEKASVMIKSTGKGKGYRRLNTDDTLYRALLGARDEELGRKVEAIDAPYRPAFYKFAARVSDIASLGALPTSTFYVAAQAYDFACKHRQEDSFFTGLNDSLTNGTTDQWAKAIIDHFRKDTKGGGNYRSLERSVAV